MSSVHPTEKHIVVWVQHRGDRDTLQLEWHDQHGKRRSRSAGTCNPVEAERKRAALEYELNHGLYREPSRMTWERFRATFEAEYLPGVRPKTRKLFTNVLNLFERFGKPAQLRSVTERTVSAFVAGMRQMKIRGGKVGLAPYSIFVRLRFLRAVLSWAVGQKLLPSLPMFPPVKVPKKKPAPVPSESFERLLAKAADPQMRAFLLAGWLAGLRLAEGCALEWEPTDTAPWVDLVHNRIWLPAEVCKGAEDQWLPLDPELRKALEALPRQGRKVFRFVNPRTGGPVTADAIGKRVRHLAKRAGVKLSAHALRRGFGCRYAAKVSAQVLQKLMRHSDIKITMDYYANVDQAVEEAVLGPSRVSSRVTPPRGADSADLPSPLDPT